MSQYPIYFRGYTRTPLVVSPSVEIEPEPSDALHDETDMQIVDIALTSANSLCTSHIISDNSEGCFEYSEDKHSVPVVPDVASAQDMAAYPRISLETGIMVSNVTSVAPMKREPFEPGDT